MKPRSENQRDKKRLETTIKICDALLKGEIINLSDSDINCWPSQFPVISMTRAKKEGLILKRGQSHVCSYDWQIPGGGKAWGKYYLVSSFKTKSGAQASNICPF